MHRINVVMLTAALCGCGDSAQLTQPGATGQVLAPSAQHDVAKVLSFDIEKLPSLGGTRSSGNSINGRAWIAGYSNLPGGQSRHAALWRDGSILDLGTLGGPNSNVPWPGLNDRGMIAGISEIAALDTLGETWSCASFFPAVTGPATPRHVCRGFVWDNGVMTALPTLGGENGFATGVNDRGQVVGWAETLVRDPTCNAPQVLQFRAVIWEPKEKEVTQLHPLPGDSTSAATAINNRGQVVGISGKCDVAVGEFSAAHAVLWEHGQVKDIGNLGGVAWNTPMDINEAGDVVGFSDLTGDADGNSNAHAFLWTKKNGIQDLGTLPGDQTSQALGINARRQVVGTSCGATYCRAFLWQDGVMRNLNKLVGAGFADSLVTAQDINNAGKITGRVYERSTRTSLAFMATPAHGK